MQRVRRGIARVRYPRRPIGAVVLFQHGRAAASDRRAGTESTVGHRRIGRRILHRHRPIDRRVVEDAGQVGRRVVVVVGVVPKRGVYLRPVRAKIARRIPHTRLRRAPSRHQSRRTGTAGLYGTSRHARHDGERR